MDPFAHVTRTANAPGRTRADKVAGPLYTCFGEDVTVRWAVPNNVIVGYADVPDYNNELNGASPHIRFVGSSISGFLAAYNDSVVSVRGSIIESSVYAYQQTLIHIQEGCVAYNLVACSRSVINFESGAVGGDLQALGGTITLRGGSVGGDLQALGSGAIHIFGRGLGSRLVAGQNGFRQYVLTGVLEDGTDIAGKTLYIQNGPGALFTLHNALSPCLPC